MVASSLLGDSLILIASIKYKAFNLHKTIVTIIQHMAVNDLLNTIGSVAPAMLSTIYNTGSPNRFIDYWRFITVYYTGAANSVFISTLALAKLLLLKYPFRQRSLSKKHAHKICAGIWAICLFIPVQQLAIGKDDAIFDYRTYFCSYRYTSSSWKILIPVNAFFFLIAPEITVVVSTVLILKEAKKVVRRTQKCLRWQGVTTVVLTATVYLTAFFPFTIYIFVEPFVENDPDKPGKFYIEFNRVANGVLQFNVLSNFFIYSLTVTSFRRFLVTKVYETFSVCLKKSSSQGSVHKYFTSFIKGDIR